VILTLAHPFLCAPPSSRLLIHVGDLNACSLVSLRAALERAFNVSRFEVGVINFVC
jgi:hypothetical protein